MRSLLGSFNVEDPRKMDTEAVAAAKGWYDSEYPRLNHRNGSTRLHQLLQALLETPAQDQHVAIVRNAVPTSHPHFTATGETVCGILIWRYADSN